MRRILGGDGNHVLLRVDRIENPQGIKVFVVARSSDFFRTEGENWEAISHLAITSIPDSGTANAVSLKILTRLAAAKDGMTLSEIRLNDQNVEGKASVERLLRPCVRLC